MNRIWLAVGLTAAMIALCGVLLFSAWQITEDMTGTLDELLLAEEGDRQVMHTIEQLHDRWDRYEKTLTIHVRHSEIEEVTYALTEMKSCWEMGEYELFVMACEEAKVAVDHLWEASRPSLKNVL